MEKHTDVSKTADCPPKDATKAAKDKNLAAEAEAAAAKDEPMGSIAAAVPGDDKAAEDAMKPCEDPGAEERKTPKESGPTAGTEFHREDEKAARKKNAA